MIDLFSIGDFSRVTHLSVEGAASLPRHRAARAGCGRSRDGVPLVLGRAGADRPGDPPAARAQHAAGPGPGGARSVERGGRRRTRPGDRGAPRRGWRSSSSRRSRRSRRCGRCSRARNPISPSSSGRSTRCPRWRSARWWPGTTSRRGSAVRSRRCMQPSAADAETAAGPDGALYSAEFFELHAGEVTAFVPVAGVRAGSCGRARRAHRDPGGAIWP